MNTRTVEVINKFKYGGVCTLLTFVSLNSFADDNWVKHEAHMQCGPAFVQLNTECKSDPGDSTVNICRYFTLKITKDNKINSYALPYMPDSQRKSLESQGYKFNRIVEAGDWAPQTMACYDNQYINITYYTGINSDEEVNGSLTDGNAPFFDLNGEFVIGEKYETLSQRALRNGTNNTYVNFIPRQ